MVIAHAWHYSFVRLSMALFESIFSPSGMTLYMHDKNLNHLIFYTHICVCPGVFSAIPEKIQSALIKPQKGYISTNFVSSEFTELLPHHIETN